jgi:hypothetical protein
VLKIIPFLFEVASFVGEDVLSSLYSTLTSDSMVYFIHQRCAEPHSHSVLRKKSCVVKYPLSVYGVNILLDNFFL